MRINRRINTSKPGIQEGTDLSVQIYLEHTKKMNRKYNALKLEKERERKDQ